jgi:hypothetical protein
MLITQCSSMLITQALVTVAARSPLCDSLQETIYSLNSSSTSFPTSRSSSWTAFKLQLQCLSTLQYGSQFQHPHGNCTRNCGSPVFAQHPCICMLRIKPNTFRQTGQPSRPHAASILINAGLLCFWLEVASPTGWRPTSYHPHFTMLLGRVRYHQSPHQRRRGMSAVSPPSFTAKHCGHAWPKRTCLRVLEGRCSVPVGVHFELVLMPTSPEGGGWGSE